METPLWLEQFQQRQQHTHTTIDHKHSDKDEVCSTLHNTALLCSAYVCAQALRLHARSARLHLRVAVRRYCCTLVLAARRFLFAYVRAQIKAVALFLYLCSARACDSTRVTGTVHENTGVSSQTLAAARMPIDEKNDVDCTATAAAAAPKATKAAMTTTMENDIGMSGDHLVLDGSE